MHSKLNAQTALPVVGFLLVCLVVVFPNVGNAWGESKPLNILLFTADDLHYESVGAFVGEPADVTPHLDRLAQEGMRFTEAHVNASICAPSRAVIATGLYSHRSGAMGFMKARPETPQVVSLFQNAGYLTGILGKVDHSTPTTQMHWDYQFDRKELGNGRNPDMYYQRCKAFFDRCKQEGKPFYFMVNSHDPHRPFCKPKKLLPGAAMPSKTYAPQDVVVPGFLPDLPGVRRELAHYLNSARRLDDTMGRVLEALEESSFAENTLVVFLSDNGIAVPFAKANCWFYSTRTPLIVRWPGVTKADSVDKTHLISGVDLLPTFLDAADVKGPEKLDGRSIVPLLRGETQDGRDAVFTQIDTKADGKAVPIRCVQTKRFAYIYNPFSDSQHVYRNNNEGQTMRAMERAAKHDAKIAERVKFFRYRVPEEFYDLQKDPDCRNNLISDPEYQKDIDQLRAWMETWMKETDDPMLPAFQHRDDRPEVDRAIRQAY